MFSKKSGQMLPPKTKVVTNVFVVVFQLCFDDFQIHVDVFQLVLFTLCSTRQFTLMFLGCCLPMFSGGPLVVEISRFIGPWGRDYFRCSGGIASRTSKMVRLF